MSSRFWLFTSFKVDNFSVDSNACQYCVYQVEQCPVTGREHVQGYIEFHRRVRQSTVQLAIRDRTAHVERRRGSQKEAIDYCSKTESRIQDPIHIGVPSASEQGRRTDLVNFLEDVREGKRVRDLWTDYGTIMIKYPRGVQDALLQYGASRCPTVPVRVAWIHGRTGSGKSRLAHQVLPRGVNYWKPDSSRWWPTYTGQASVVLDDWSPSECGLSETHLKYWLRVLDRYPLMVETKGGYVGLTAVIFLITTVEALEYALSRFDVDNQLHRRIGLTVNAESTPSECAVEQLNMFFNDVNKNDIT